VPAHRELSIRQQQPQRTERGRAKRARVGEVLGEGVGEVDHALGRRPAHARVRVRGRVLDEREDGGQVRLQIGGAVARGPREQDKPAVQSGAVISGRRHALDLLQQGRERCLATERGGEAVSGLARHRDLHLALLVLVVLAGAAAGGGLRPGAHVHRAESLEHHSAEDGPRPLRHRRGSELLAHEGGRLLAQRVDELEREHTRSRGESAADPRDRQHRLRGGAGGRRERPCEARSVEGGRARVRGRKGWER
jgi:hypothetical protein